MENHVIDMPSYTYAVKGNKLLNSHGIKSMIVRCEKKCGYSLKTESDCDEAEKLLDKYHIPYDKPI